jgi:hypothetical protein
LAGTEVLPIVQSSATTQVSVANLTAGRSVSGSNFVVTSSTIPANGVYLPAANSVGVATNSTLRTTVDASGNLGIGAASPVDKLQVVKALATTGTGIVAANGLTLQNTDNTVNNYTTIQNLSSTGAQNSQIQFINVTHGAPHQGIVAFSTRNSVADFAERMRISAVGGVSIGTTTDAGVGNLLMGTGNITQGTAAKGFNFSANTPLAGKTSTLLNWYEEGTWTPNQGAGLTLVGAFSSTGTYTRIGRQVSIAGTVTGATSVAVTAAGVVTSNLPFTVVSAGHGGATNVAINASSTVICTGTSVTSAGAIAATATITFSATYFV